MRKYSIPEYKQVVTPANPASWFNKIYFKSDNKAYTLDSTWTEVEVWTWSWGWAILLEDSTTENDSYVIPAYTTLVDNLLIPFFPDTSNTWAATLNYWGTWAKAIVNGNWDPLVDDDIDIGRMAFLKYDLANDNFVILAVNATPYYESSNIVSTNVVYSITNWLVDRDFDANATSVDELMDVLDTLTNDLEWASVFWSWNPSSIVQTYIANNATGVRTLDCNVTSIDELADIVATIIADLSNGNMFNGWVLQESNQTYTVTNLTLDRAWDANSTTINELADLVWSVITDLKATNFIL